MPRSRHLVLTSTAALLVSGGAFAQIDVDLRNWTAESYPAVSGFGAGDWQVAPDGATVTQQVNGQPTFFYSDFPVFNTAVTGTITTSGGDDDYIGFALGFEPGDSTNSEADYLLIDWKGSRQSFNFGAPACTPGSVAEVGLAVSRVRGVPTADEFWGHEDFDEPACSPLGQGLTELARGANLGSTGWSPGNVYTFRFEFTADNLRVFVDDQLEMDISGEFGDGRMAFYNFSQAGVTYSAFTLECQASWNNYGDGWPGTLGVPSLTLAADPILGTEVDVLLGNAAGEDSHACLIWGIEQIQEQTLFGGTLLVEKMGAIPFTPFPAVGATYVFDIPDDPVLCGTKMYGQTVHLDTGASAGVAFSQGVELFLGIDEGGG